MIDKNMIATFLKTHSISQSLREKINLLDNLKTQVCTTSDIKHNNSMCVYTVI
jgi:hypothetical protein